MYQYFVEQPIETTVFLVLVVGVAFLILVKCMRTIGMEKVRKEVYQAFLKAEHRFRHGDNDLKFEYVVDVAKKSLPAPFNLFITETLLRDVIQLWFDLIKDLLDDGKLNGTGKEDW